MVTVEEEYYLRSSFLLLKGGTFIARKVLIREEQKAGRNLGDLIVDKEGKLRNEFRNHKQREKLFPPDGKTEVEDWDISLLTGVLEIVFRSSLSIEDKRAVRSIKHHRNEVYAHRAISSLSEDNYTDICGELKAAFTLLAAGIDTEVHEEFNRLVRRCLHGPLDIKSHIEHLKRISDTDDMFHDILEICRTIYDRQPTKSELTALVKDAVQEALQVKRHTRIVKVIDSELEVSGKEGDQPNVDLVEHMINTVTNEAIRRTESSKECTNIRIAIQDILDGLRSNTGIKALGAEIRCVTIRLNSCTYAQMLSLLNYLESEDMKQRLKRLAIVLSRHFNMKEHLHLSVSLSLETLESIMAELGKTAAETFTQTDKSGVESSLEKSHVRSKTDKTVDDTWTQTEKLDAKSSNNDKTGIADYLKKEQPHQLETPGYIFWLKVGLILLYLKEGLLKFVADITEAEHKRILSKSKLTKDYVCNDCDLKILRPKHNSKAKKHNGSREKTCPLGSNNCNCIKSKTIPCPKNVCGAIYEEIIKCHAFTPPSPRWENTDVHKWCSSSFEVAKCFINASGYLQKATLSEIDCAGLIHMVICNHRIQSHINCQLDGNDVFSMMLQHRNKIFHSHSLEIREQELISILEDSVSILEDTKELKQRRDARASVKKIRELKNTNLKITSDEEAYVCKAAMTAMAMLPEGYLKDMSETMEFLKKKINQLEGDNAELPIVHYRMDHLEKQFEVIDIYRRTPSSVAKKQTLDLQQQRFLQLYLWNTEGGACVFDGILQREAQNMDTSVSDLLMQNKEKIQDKIKSEYHDKVFPPCGKQLDMRQWDTRLYLEVLQGIFGFGTSLTSKERRYISRIQNMQPVIEKHSATASVDELTYADITAELTNTLSKLVKGLDESTRSQFWKMENRYIRYTGDGADLFHRLKTIPSITANANDLISLLENQMTEKGEASTFGSPTEENTDLTSDDATTEENRLRESVTAFVSNPENELNIMDRMGTHRSTKATPEKLTEWEKAEVNIAVVGRSGTGKSTLVNALRDIKVGDVDYAKTGVTETTIAAACYAHPKNHNVKIWDLPGYETQSFPFATYLDNKKISVKPYDVFIITTCSRIYANDIDLAKELDKRKQFYLFVRSQCDNHIQSKNQDEDKQILQTIRKDCATHLKEMSIKTKDIYLISGKNRNHPLLDFEKLTIRILDNLTELKRDALLFSMPVTTDILLERKISVLKKRMWIVACMSCGGAIFPVPGLSLAIDLALINKEIEFYKNQLGLCMENLKKVTQITGIGAEELSEKFQFKSMKVSVVKSSTNIVITFVHAVTVLKTVAASEIIEKGAVFIPVVGSFVGGAISFASTYYTLNYILKAMSEDARKVVHILNEEGV